VTITLDGSEDQIECFVRSVTAPVATLGQFGGIPSQLRRRLSPGVLGYMTFSHDGVPVALRGVATVDCVSEPDLGFVALDGVKLPERRTAPRVELATPARVFIVGPGGTTSQEAIETATADLSLGGVLLERRPGIGITARLRVELYFGLFPTPVRCEAEVVRQTNTHLGLRFTEMPEADRVRLAEILAYQQRRCAR